MSEVLNVLLGVAVIFFVVFAIALCLSIGVGVDK